MPSQHTAAERLRELDAIAYFFLFSLVAFMMVQGATPTAQITSSLKAEGVITGDPKRLEILTALKGTENMVKLQEASNYLNVKAFGAIFIILFFGEYFTSFLRPIYKLILWPAAINCACILAQFFIVYLSREDYIDKTDTTWYLKVVLWIVAGQLLCVIIFCAGAWYFMRELYGSGHAHDN